MLHINHQWSLEYLELQESYCKIKEENKLLRQGKRVARQKETYKMHTHVLSNAEIACLKIQLLERAYCEERQEK